MNLANNGVISLSKYFYLKIKNISLYIRLLWKREIKSIFMKLRENLLPTTLILFVTSLLSSCQLVVDIFKGGVYVGIILVIVVIAIVIWILSKINNR